jgi:DNA-binding MarR family transcriptional regulator
MAFRLKAGDYQTLESIAECRIVTVTQITVLLNKKKQAIWRRLRELEKQGFLQIDQREFGHGRGRPEKVLSLSERGVDILKEKTIMDTETSYEAVTADKIYCPDHQLMLNCFRIHLHQIERVLPKLSIRFWADSSPFLPKNSSGFPIIAAFAPVEGSIDEAVRFTPDAAFSITDTVREITLPFFLEVDCGTETIGSPKRPKTDVRQKILNYQSYFRNLNYKRYEKLWNCKLDGFRLLFLTNTLGRMTSLCKLVQEMPPSDFIWLTEQSRLFRDGVSAEIWVRGGKIEASPQSILGSLCCRAPLP